MLTMKQLVLIPIFACVSIIGTGCGGSSSGESSKNDSDSGLTSSRKLSSLSASESRQLCGQTVDLITSRYSKDDACKLVGVLDGSFALLSGEGTKAENIALCQESYDACLAQAGEPVFDNNEACSAYVNKTAACNATIGQYRNCVNDQADEIEAYFGSLSCKIIGQANVVNTETPNVNTPPESPACVSVKQQCPDLYNDNSEE